MACSGLAIAQEPRADGYPKMGLLREVAISADGKRAFGGDSERTIWVWDVRSRKVPTAIFERDKNRERTSPTYGFSADGKVAVVGSRKKYHPGIPSAKNDPDFLALWDLERGVKVRTFDTRQEHVNLVAMSPDGKRVLSVSVDERGRGADPPHGIQVVRLWDTDGKIVRHLVTWAGGFLPVAFSADSKLCAVVCDAGRPAGFRELKSGQPWVLYIWDTESGKPIQSIEGSRIETPSDDIHTIAFSPGNKHIATGCGKEVTLWSVETGRVVWCTSGGPRIWIPRSMAFSQDGKYLAYAGPDTDWLSGTSAQRTGGGIQMVHADTGKNVAAFSGTKEWVRAVSFSSDGKSLAGATANGLRLWGSSKGEALDLFTK
jgi:WD40 repeat protein